MSESKKPKQGTKKFAVHHDGRTFVPTDVGSKPTFVGKLPPGVYTVEWREGFFGPPTLILRKAELINERYLDLGGPASRVMQVAEAFFDGKHTARLKERGFLNKLAMLLHGPPGTGKSLVSNEVARLAIEKGAVVLRYAGGFNADTMREMLAAVKEIREVMPDQLCVFQFDDCEQLFLYEHQLLANLDGEQQVEGILWMFTTNFGHQMPERVLSRSRRIQFQFPFGPPSAPMRRKYLKMQGIEGKDLEKFVTATAGFTIDQIAGLITSTLMFNQPADEVLQEVRIRQQVQTQTLDFAEYTEAFFGEQRNVTAKANTRDGYITDPVSGRQVLRADVEASLAKAAKGQLLGGDEAMRLLTLLLSGMGQSIQNGRQHLGR